MTKKPLIGITMDWQESGSFSTRPHVCLREHYFQAIHKAGGLAIAIPYHQEALPEYMEMIDGVVVPGGDFAFRDEWYIDPSATKPFEPSPRLDSDITLLEHCFQKKIPIFGICAGMQMMGAMHGCKLTEDVHGYYNLTTHHTNETSRTVTSHEVLVEPDSLFHQIVGCDSFRVNTAHREAIIEVSDAVHVSAKASDGVIEAIEIPSHPFAIGVQWHPEFFTEEESPHFALFKALIAACA